MQTKIQKYNAALLNAQTMMMEYDDLEPTSALKQAASDIGIPFGEEMREFILWANEILFGNN